MREGLIDFLPCQHDLGDPGQFVGKRNGHGPEWLFLAQRPDPVCHGRGLVLDILSFT